MRRARAITTVPVSTVWKMFPFREGTISATKNGIVFAQGSVHGILSTKGELDARYVMSNYSAALFAEGSRVDPPKPSRGHSSALYESC